MPFITPSDIPSTEYCGRLLVPDNPYILAAVHGVMDELGKPENWEQVTGVTEIAIAEAMRQMQDTLWKGQRCMIGTITHYITVSPPEGILKCDGSQHLRVDFPRLYDELPVSLIVDADNFVTPTIEDVFIIATGAGHAQEDTGGADTHTLDVDEIPSHYHTYNKPTFNIDVESVGIPDPTGVGLPELPASTSLTGGGNAHNNMPPYVAYHVGLVAR